MFDAILKKLVPIPRVADYDSYLFIGPHPDDIETGCAPSVLELTRRGKKVSFLIVTDGGAGAQDPASDRAALVETRRAESIAAALLLGVHDVRFLNLPDGGMYSEDDCIAAIAKEVVRQKPAAIFVCDPDVRSECHPDHLKVGRAAKTVALMSGYPLVTKQWGVAGAHALQALFLYYTDRPNSFLNVRRAFFARDAALTEHASQYPAELRALVVKYYLLRSIRFGLPRFCGKCDGYRALAPMHMHCFPEASRW